MNKSIPVGIVSLVLVAVAAYGIFGVESASTAIQSDPLTIQEKEIETEKEIHRLVNIERINHNLEPLEYDDGLAMIAKRHSQDMNNRGYFSHETPEGKTPTDRSDEFG